MNSEFSFYPLGISETAQRYATSFNVVWNGVSGGINLGVVRKSSGTRWTGIYAWTFPSQEMDSKVKVAEWMLVQYMTSQVPDMTA